MFSEDAPARGRLEFQGLVAKFRVVGILMLRLRDVVLPRRAAPQEGPRDSDSPKEGCHLNGLKFLHSFLS